MEVRLSLRLLDTRLMFLCPGELLVYGVLRWLPAECAFHQYIS